MNIRYLSYCIDTKLRYLLYCIDNKVFRNRLAKEPNAINVRLDQKSQEQIPYEIYSVTPPEGMPLIELDNLIQGYFDNHTDIVNEQTVEVIKKAMGERRE